MPDSSVGLRSGFGCVGQARLSEVYGGCPYNRVSDKVLRDSLMRGLGTASPTGDLAAGLDS